MKTTLSIYLLIFGFQCYAQKSDFESIDFNKADRVALEFKNESLNSLPELSHKLTSNLTTEVERFRAIYIWVCNNIANDYAQYSKNMRKRQRFKNDSLKLENWNQKFRKTSFETLLSHQKTICTGYAHLVKELARLADIDCEIVHGFAKTSTINIDHLDVPNHSWIAVKLDAKWYLCDPTWASGIPNPSTLRFEFKYNDGYFLANPKLFAINHYPEDKKWLLIDKDEPSFEMFLEAPIIYGKAYEHLKSYESPKKMHNTIIKNETITFEFQPIKSVELKDIGLSIDSGNSNYKIHPKMIKLDGDSIILKHKFEHTGFYDVHLYIGTDLISTHTFKVKS